MCQIRGSGLECNFSLVVTWSHFCAEFFVKSQTFSLQIIPAKKKPVLFYAWNRWCLNAKCTFGWMLDGVCPCHPSFDFIVSLSRQQLFGLKVGLSYARPNGAADGTALPLCMNPIISLFTYPMQMVICNQVHKAENYSKGVWAMKSSLLCTAVEMLVVSIWMNEWKVTCNDGLPNRNSYSYPNSKAKPK